MSIVWVGSVALNAHQFTRNARDIDVVCTYDSFKELLRRIKMSGEIVRAQYPICSGAKFVVKTDKNIYEAEIAWEGSSAESLINLIQEDAYSLGGGGEDEMASLDVLYLLKMSHRYLKDSPAFLKTMNDIILMRKMGAKIRPEHEEFYKQRMKDTYKNTSLPKLNQSKGMFFDNSNNIYTLNHDDIHEAVKHLDKPAYELFKADSAEVMCSKELFFKLDKSVQLLAALEEVMVLSIERSIHPYLDVDRKWAFEYALMKLSTSISSGWFREFTYENYYTILSMYNEEYIDKFYDALHNGRIGKFKERNNEY